MGATGPLFWWSILAWDRCWRWKYHRCWWPVSSNDVPMKKGEQGAEHLGSWADEEVNAQMTLCLRSSVLLIPFHDLSVTEQKSVRFDNHGRPDEIEDDLSEISGNRAGHLVDAFHGAFALQMASRGTAPRGTASRRSSAKSRDAPVKSKRQREKARESRCQNKLEWRTSILKFLVDNPHLVCMWLLHLEADRRILQQQIPTFPFATDSLLPTRCQNTICCRSTAKQAWQLEYSGIMKRRPPGWKSMTRRDGHIAHLQSMFCNTLNWSVDKGLFEDYWKSRFHIRLPSALCSNSNHFMHIVSYNHISICI